MSAINNALSELANSHSNQPEQVVKAKVKPVKQLKVLPWVVGSFGLSLAVGGWALSTQAPVVESQPLTGVSVDKTVEVVVSPTSKSSVSSDAIYLPQRKSDKKNNPPPSNLIK